MAATLWFVLWLLGPQSTVVSVQGVVVRAGTTQPLVGEVVGLWPTSRVVKTDAEGRFSFRDVVPGDYALTVVHDGIKVQVPVALAVGRRFDNPTIEVPSAPAITGTVFDPNGERVAGAHVQAYRTVFSPLGPAIQSVMSAATDDLGEFRLYRLRAGEYYVSAGSSEYELGRAIKGLRPTPNLSNPDDGFPTIYFGGGFTQFEAQKVRLNRTADTSGLQIFLKDPPRYTISGPLFPEGVCARVFVVPEGGILNPETDFAANRCGSFRVTGLSRGNYSILAVNETMASEVIRVTTTNLSTEVKVPLVNSVTITGRVTGDVRGGSNNAVNVRLARASRDIAQEIQVSLSADGQFAIPGVGPGLYSVSLQPLPERVFIRTINFRGFDGLLNPIRVDSQGLNRLDIQVSPSAVVAEGIVVDRSGRVVPGAEVVLVPKDPRSRTREDRYLATTADAGGNFRFAGVPPIDYAVLAYEELDARAYYAFAYDLSLYSRSIASAQHLNAGVSNSQFKLIAVPAAETAGGLR